MTTDRSLRRLLGWFAVGVAAFLAVDAAATITQVDGTIVPTTNDLQSQNSGDGIGLDYTPDGLPDTDGNALDAWLDAAQVPQVFLPNPSGSVVFTDLLEQAGFENSFGWYNVGDDVFTPAGRARNLHPILGCGVPMVDDTSPGEDPTLLSDAELLGSAHNGHHHGTPTEYFEDAEHGDSISVNFGSNRYYKGGFIGFYLITPEDYASGHNCGDYAGNATNSTFSYNYFTQPDLNNDGDFVHHLVYTSRRVSDRFYFTFEDLFRGGDNDFTDMLIQVEGLTPPCVPQAEVCDGLDNDCDGEVDNDPTDIGDPCTCDGSAMTCDAVNCVGGTNCQGECLNGVTVCSGGAIECLSGSQSAEACDGLDNDCDGSADEDVAGTGGACDGVDGDLCNEGTMECNGVAIVCTDTTGTSVETCNGVDDDCNGTVDDDPTDPSLGSPCDSPVDTDRCNGGVYQCVGGAIECSDDDSSIPELCNGADDDCDGTVDNDVTDVGVACTAGIGECETSGFTVCSGGTPTCDAVAGAPASESCNGLDDDCDGDTDEQPSGDPLVQACYTGPAATRGVGLCSDGTQVCSGGSYSGACLGEVLPVGETCDGLDNDCSGVVDDNVPGTGAGFPCDGPDGDQCQEGTMECNGVAIVCNDTTGTNQEVCNGLDDDCDGSFDESPTDPTLGDPCDNPLDTDLCTDGVIVCSGGGLTCSDDEDSIVELCNGLDDDCDGTIDNDVTDVGVACTAGIGECQTSGVTVCTDGAPVCDAVPGAPIAEECNGLDDDCDGEVDEQPSGDPLVQTCYTGAAATRGVGLCHDGYQQCLGGSFSGPCDGQVLPVGELCDGQDNDCDSSVDEDIPGTGASFPCDGPDGDQCDEGTMECNGVAIVCNDATGTNQELCNGADDDCNGTIDDGVTDPTLGDPCDSPVDTDACLDGVIICTATGLDCSDDALSIVELCNGLDDDCDTIIDNDPTDVGVACSAGIGACQRSGFTVCSGGVPTCNAVPGTPGTELCNGLDDDCDTIIDNGFNVGADCDGIGECGPGVYECSFSGLGTICSTDVGGSADESVPEVCNGLDDDCDGEIDEGLTNMGPCGTDEGECSIGVATCISGTEVCVGSIGPVPEICDGLDNDCDTEVDEDPVDVGLPCGDTNVGECEYGLTECTPSDSPPDPPTITCVGDVGPGEEVCNGLDDDCDGLIDAVDPDIVGLGDPCGDTDVGECEYGEIVCIIGVEICSGTIGPVAEICDNLDNDCNGVVDDDPIDIGTPCGVSTGICTPGTWQCLPFPDLRTCVDPGGGSSEVCNGLDDDCNGLIDDGDLPGVDEPCGEEEGACEPGLMKCISGGLQCVGGVMPTTEICNGIDDDCDGTIDDGELCTGGVCLDGMCSVPCGAEEFLCPVDQMCVDGYCIPNPCWDVTCPNGSDGELNVCVDGECMPVCDTVTCPENLVCRPTDGMCVPDNCFYLPSLCEDNQVCIDAECVTDLCYEVTCPAEQFCREGDCIGSCAGVDCPTGEECKDGECIATGCTEDCSDTEYCNPDTGRCEHDPCLATQCDVGQICESTSGDCIPDICTGITCPGDQVCSHGNCYESNRPDAGPEPEYVYAGGGGGCAVGRDGAGGGAPWLLLLGLVGLIGVRRRRRPVALGLLLLGLLLLVGSCNVDPYCLNCEQGANGDGGNTGDDGGAGVVDARIVTGCDAGVVGAEICDGEDNDCDGYIDEDFNLDGDPLNCGACGVTCLKTGASAICNEGQCEIVACLPGHVDHNGDIDGPFDDSDGCEYACFVSNDGTEACDGLDNDCDGDIDEDTDFQGDESNCGECGRVCGAFEANVTCVSGDCVYDPATDCHDGFHDINLDPADGCEYQCDPTGSEVCDYRDNDCNGTVDDGFALATDPTNCGQCGRVCSFYQAVASCAAGVCFFDPDTDCMPGYVDANGNQLDGCEYPCTKTNGGVEICDLQDNDCNGVVDDSPLGVGGSCHNAPGPDPEGDCTETGTLTCVVGEIQCVGAPEPEVEVCDDHDNDCNGLVDDDPVDAGALCMSPVGMCSPGILVCNTGGSLDCEQEIGPTDELCNGLDDDCDGEVDEDAELSDPGLGLPCGSDVGTCVQGTLICDHDLGKLVCDGEIGPHPETCNNLNDDCDSETDEGLTNLGVCGSSQGDCVQGTLVCDSGGIVDCINELGPQPETCDGHDEDCDGDTDEDDLGNPLTAPCYTGSPGTEGHGVCVGGSRTCVSGAYGACAGQVVDHVESCNGVDDDCDDATDEDVLGNPLSRACYTGDPATRRVGQCADGYQQCLGGAYAGNPCVDEVLPAAGEVCDNVDNDCNGSVDDNVPGTGVPCDGDDLDDCEEGTWECNGVAVVCTDTTGTIVELCNGVDDDCNGTIDDDPTDPALLVPCDSADDTDLCQDDHHVCSGGGIVCEDQGGSHVELCNGVDDDCNGTIDDDPADVGAACSVGVGACQVSGVIECVGGSPVCNAVAGTPGSEVCNGIDDDCDGDVDEDGSGNPLTQACYTGDPATRGVGECSDGVQQCLGGGFAGNPCVGQQLPAASESCNGADDDCNGSVDDNVPGTGGGCDGTDSDDCDEGTWVCNGSAIVCTDNTGDTPEVCNGVDDDCNGTIDDDPKDPSLGKACDDPADTDLCKDGVNICQGGGIVCTDDAASIVEVCDGVDNDCNGTIDDNLTDVGVACSSGVGACLASGVTECSSGTPVCNAVPGTPILEVCNDIDDDCDGDVDEQPVTGDPLVTACYTGDPDTRSVGACSDGWQECLGGSYSGPCHDEVLPDAEVCDDVDNDCDGAMNEDAAGDPLTQACYTGSPPSTEDQGTCVGGTQTCVFGVWGACLGETTPTGYDLCGDGLDTDCDNLDDAAEGCCTLDDELRLDAPGGGEGTSAGAQHSFDVQLARAGNNVYAVWSDLDGAADIYYRRSTDGGVTWGDIINLTDTVYNTGYACVKPQIVAAGSNVYVAFQRFEENGDGDSTVRRLYVMRSDDSGASFGDTTRMDEDVNNDSFHHHLATNADGTRVAVVWEELDVGTLDRDVLIRRSVDAGNNFGTRVVVNVGSGSSPIAGRPQVAITGTGDFVVVWREARVGNTFDVYTNWSPAGDASATFSPGDEVRLDSDSADNRNSDYPQLVAAEDSLYVVWEDISTLLSGGSDVVFSRSVDGGASWSAEQILDDPVIELSSSFSPRVALDAAGAGGSDDRLFVAWVDDREGTQIYATRSTDGGASFATAARASSDAGAPISGETQFPVLAYGGGETVVVAYVNGMAGEPRHVFATSSIDGGQTWQVTHSLLDTGIGTTQTPAITAVSGGGVTNGAAVSWIDFRSGTQRYGDPYLRVVGH